MLLLYHLCYLVMICLELVVGLIKAWPGTAPGVPFTSPFAQGCQELEMLQKLHPQKEIQPQPELMPKSVFHSDSAQPFWSLFETNLWRKMSCGTFQVRSLSLSHDSYGVSAFDPASAQGSLLVRCIFLLCSSRREALGNLARWYHEATDSACPCQPLWATSPSSYGVSLFGSRCLDLHRFPGTNVFCTRARQEKWGSHHC